MSAHCNTYTEELLRSLQTIFDLQSVVIANLAVNSRTRNRKRRRQRIIYASEITKRQQRTLDQTLKEARAIFCDLKTRVLQQQSENAWKIYAQSADYKFPSSTGID